MPQERKVDHVNVQDHCSPAPVALLRRANSMSVRTLSSDTEEYRENIYETNINNPDVSHLEKGETERI